SALACSTSWSPLRLATSPPSTSRRGSRAVSQRTLRSPHVERRPPPPRVATRRREGRARTRRDVAVFRRPTGTRSSPATRSHRHFVTPLAEYPDVLGLYGLIALLARCLDAGGTRGIYAAGT